MVLFCFLAVYTFRKLKLINSNDEVHIVEAARLNHFQEDNVFNYKMGFNAAVAFTAWDSEREPILDPTIGELYFYYIEWGFNDDGTIFVNQGKLDSHPCTREELGIDKGDSKFMPIHEKSF